MNDEVIILPTKKEKEQAFQEFKELFCWSRELSAEQVNFLCDGGYYNNTIRGYLITAAKNAKFTEEQTRELLLGLNWALSELNKADAEKVSNEY